MYREFLRSLWAGKGAGGYILVWLYDGDKHKESFWHTDAEAAISTVEKAVDRRLNVYTGVGLSPKDQGPHARYTKAEAVGIAGLWIDIDMADPVHKKKNLPRTLDETDELLGEMPKGFEPSIVVNSGHGIQAWWIFKEPWIFDSATERADAEQLERRLNMYFKEAAGRRGWDVDSVYNLDRVMRVPGTLNIKGRPVPVTILRQDNRRFNPADFEWLPEAQGTGADNGAHISATITLDAAADPPFDKFQALCTIEPKFAQSWDKQRKEFQDQSPSAYDLSLARFAYMYGWSDQEVANLIIAFRRRHGDDLKLRMDYYQRTLACASRGVEKQRAAEDIDAHVESQNPAAATAGLDKNEKEAILQSLGALFDVRIIQIIKFTSDPPLYKLKTARGDISLGEVDNLINQQRLRTHIAAGTGKYLPRFKGERWDNIAQALLDCCYEVELGEDATEAGETRNWLAQYLEAKPPFNEDELEEAAIHMMPVKVKGRVAIFGNDFRKWLRVTQQEKITAKKMGMLLRSIGCEPDRMPVEIKGKRTSRNVWYLREDEGE